MSNTDQKKLGFGLMRLPRKALFTDIKQTSEMVDLFLDNGFTYFDTAYVYPGSEKAIKQALVDRYPRDKYTMATKINAFMALNEKQAKNQFYSSLKKTGLEYFDYYLLHSIMNNNYNRYNKFGLWDFVNEQKEKGLIKNVGFSFHSGPELLDRILTEHPEVDFVQLQINYEDWENPSVTSRKNYEVARKHQKPIVIMEPIKGGRLANPPEEIKKLFREYHPNLSESSWAIRFAASLDGVTSVLSGMSNVDQMKDNISYMKDFKPLNAEEQKIIQQAQRILGNSATIPCTSCHYCTNVCPKNIPIPDIINALNMQLGNGQLEEAKKEYQKVTTNTGKATDCINCKQCEGACPQHLPITSTLKNVNFEV